MEHSPTSAIGTSWEKTWDSFPNSGFMRFKIGLRLTLVRISQTGIATAHPPENDRCRGVRRQRKGRRNSA